MFSRYRGRQGRSLGVFVRANELSKLVDPPVQRDALVGDLTLALAGRRGLEPEVDLVVQVAALRPQPRVDLLEGGTLTT